MRWRQRHRQTLPLAADARLGGAQSSALTLVGPISSSSKWNVVQKVSYVHGGEVNPKPHAIKAAQRPMLRDTAPRIESLGLASADLVWRAEPLQGNFEFCQRKRLVSSSLPSAAGVLDVARRGGGPYLHRKIKDSLVRLAVLRRIEFSFERVAEEIVAAHQRDRRARVARRMCGRYDVPHHLVVAVAVWRHTVVGLAQRASDQLRGGAGKDPRLRQSPRQEEEQQSDDSANFIVQGLIWQIQNLNEFCIIIEVSAEKNRIVSEQEMLLRARIVWHQLRQDVGRADIQ